MKILYLFQIGSSQSPGVFNKIISKIKSLNFFAETKAICFAKHTDIHYENFSVINSNQTFVEQLETVLEKNARLYDFIIFRYPMVSKKMINVLRKYPRKIIFEHNTLEENELLFNIKSLSLQDVGYLIKKREGRLWKEYIKPYIEEKRYGAEALSLARAGLCISNTVAQFEKQKYKKYQVLVQGNGIDLSDVSVLKNTVESDRLKLLFISGSPNKWHGVDRVLEGIKNYKGKKEILLHLIGKVHHSVLEEIKKIPTPHKVIFHGVLNREGIFNVAEECNLGIGSLALHRLGLKEGSTLKVREYMAMGLPFVVGYDDIDIPQKYEYALQVRYDDSPLDFQEIDEFLISLVAKSFSSIKMRDVSSSYIDQNVKMKQFVEFLEKI